MYKVWELIRWRDPLDADYSYGTIQEIRRGSALVLGSGYYTGVVFAIPLRYIEKVIRLGGRGCGSRKKHSK